jgi:hypothetical protein
MAVEATESRKLSLLANSGKSKKDLVPLRDVPVTSLRRHEVSHQSDLLTSDALNLMRPETEQTTGLSIIPELKDQKKDRKKSWKRNEVELGYTMVHSSSTDTILSPANNPSLKL